MDRLEQVTMDLAAWLQEHQYQNGETLVACLTIAGYLAQAFQANEAPKEGAVATTPEPLPQAARDDLARISAQLFKIGPSAVSFVCGNWASLVAHNMRQEPSVRDFWRGERGDHQ